MDNVWCSMRQLNQYKVAIDNGIPQGSHFGSILECFMILLHAIVNEQGQRVGTIYGIHKNFIAGKVLQQITAVTLHYVAIFGDFHTGYPFISLAMYRIASEQQISICMRILCNTDSGMLIDSVCDRDKTLLHLMSIGRAWRGRSLGTKSAEESFHIDMQQLN